MPEEPVTPVAEPSAETEPSSLSESSAIFDLPLVETKLGAGGEVVKQEVPEPKETPAEAPKEATEPAKETPTPEFETEPKPSEKADKKPEFETDPKEVPAKSKDAEEIRATSLPKEGAKKISKYFDDFKSKWAGIVEAKDMQLHKAEREKQAAIVALQQKNEELEKRVSHLSGYESVIDYQSSEKFQKEYDTPIKSAEDSLVSYMKEAGATEAGLDELKKGLHDSNYLFLAMASLDKNAPPQVSARFRFEVGKLMELRQRRDAAINDVKSNHQKFISERQAEQTTKQAQFQNTVKQSIDQLAKQLREDDKSPAFPFLVKMRPPANGDAETAKLVEEHNKFVEANLKDLDAAAKNDDPAHRVRMAAGYMSAVLLINVVKNLQSELKKATDWNNRVKSRTAPPERAGGENLPVKKQEFDGPLSEMVDSRFGRR